MLGEMLIYRHGDVALHGELFRPSAPVGRAILVVHEADGIGGNVRRRCAMLAERGYVALAADLHGGGRVLAGEEMTAAVDRLRTDPQALRDRTHAGLDALAAASGLPPGRIAAIGYCFGGAAVLELARSGAPVQAVGSFHGLLSTARPAQRGTILARIAAFTGARDPLVPASQIAEFQAEMERAGADWQLTVYGGALHSFTNAAVDALGDPRMGYDPTADRLSWSSLLTFLDEALHAE
jgi:dienelactone hydrolase